MDDLAEESELDLSPALMALCTLVDLVSSCDDDAGIDTLKHNVLIFITDPQTYSVLLNRVFSNNGRIKFGKQCLYLLSNSIALCHSMQDQNLTQLLTDLFVNTPAVERLL